MEFHLRVSHEWIAGDHSLRDWKASFLPQQVTPAEWQTLVEQIQQAGQHLAYHLGAIRQLLQPS